jgi:hypothetical protein
MPGFIVTGITIPALVSVIPKQYITPMETMMKGFDVFLADTEGMDGQVLDVSIDKVHFRKLPEFVNEQQRWLVEDSAGFFATAFGQTS